MFLVYLIAREFCIDFCFKYSFHFQNPGFFFNGYSTLLAPPSEVLIPPELLSSRTVWTPDRELGKFSPYWLVSNHHFSGISLSTTLLNFLLTTNDLSYDLPSYLSSGKSFAYCLLPNWTKIWLEWNFTPLLLCCSYLWIMLIFFWINNMLNFDSSELL